MESPNKRRKSPCRLGRKDRCVGDHEQQVDNSKALLQKMADCYANQLMSDVTLVVGDKSFPAHRLMLCASSDVFRVMLMNPNFCESREKQVVLTEDPRCQPVFPFFLNYMYTVRPEPISCI